MANTVPSSLSLQTMFDAQGRPIPGAQLFFFEAGTTTPKATYVDPDGLILHPYPVLTTLSGRVPVIYLGGGYYRIQVLDQFGALIDDFDYVAGYIPPEVDPTPTPSTPILPTAFCVSAFTEDPTPGWVRANGRTIGDTGSGATEYAAADAYPLFAACYLLPNLPVSGGKGASAASDFAAGKTIQLPDMRGRVMVGRDGMGNGLAGIIPASIYAETDTLYYGAGAALITLLEGHLPAHNHTGTTELAGLHNHPDSVTDTQGLHYHNYAFPAYNLDLLAASGTGGTGRNTYAPTTAASENAGSHAHSCLINSDGAHAHTFTTGDTGGDFGHPNMQPGRLITWFIKL